MTARFAQVLTIALCLALGPAAHADDRPNVLFMAIDDLDDWIGSFNGRSEEGAGQEARRSLESLIGCHSCQCDSSLTR